MGLVGCSRRSFFHALLLAGAAALGAVPCGRALALGVALPEGGAALPDQPADDPFASLPADPVERLGALCALFDERLTAFTQTYAASVQNADTAYAEPMLAFVELCARGAEEVAAARAALESSDVQVAPQVFEACDALAATLGFYEGYYRSSDPLMEFQARAAEGAYAVEEELLDALYGAMGEVRSNYRALALPAYLTDLWPRYIAQIDAYQEKIYADYLALVRDDVLMGFSSRQLLARQPYIMYRYESLMYGLMGMQLRNAAAALGADPEAEPSAYVDYAMAAEVYPNLYPSADSVVNLAVCTQGGARDLLVEVRAQGFLQEYRQKLTATPEVAFLMVKPPVAVGAADLTTERDAQLVLTVTDLATGALLVQESRPLTLHSVYDFTLASDEFGIVEPYNVLAWMRPDAQEVLEVRRGAIDWLERNLGEGYSSLPGYQLGYPGEDESTTALLQAVAIQGAVSDLGVRYNMGSYSFGTFQRVLTPDAVVRSRSGICIETALLVASALQSANMHPMVVIVPGHAQVALETWAGSGQYLLLETTVLPFTGADGQVGSFVTAPTAQEWAEYLGRDGVYVIDCDLASQLKVRGLA